MSDFFNRLDLLRKNKGEALTGVAAFLGISGPAIHGWKKGGLPKPDKLRLLAEHYGTTVEWLLSGQGPMLIESPQEPVAACQNCASLRKRISDLEAQLATAYETINNQSKALAQGRAVAAPASGACGGGLNAAPAKRERRAGA